jgi:SAM-dependent methyltransferase
MSSVADQPVTANFVQPYYKLSFFYPIANEAGENIALQTLNEQLLTTDDTCYYVGVSGLQNENYLAAIATGQYAPKQIRAVLIDINGIECQYHQIVREQLRKAKDIESFCRAMRKVKMPLEMLPRDRNLHLSIFTDKKPYWLQTNARFFAVKRLFAEDRVAILHKNLADPMMQTSLRPILGKVVVMYTSNVHEWLKDTPQMLTSFNENIGRILAPDGKEIESDFDVPGHESEGLYLSVVPHKKSRYFGFEHVDPSIGHYNSVSGPEVSRPDYTGWESIPTEHIPAWLQSDVKK